LYVACLGVTINPLTAYLSLGEDFYLLPRSGLTVNGGAPYANIPEATGIIISRDCFISDLYSYSGCLGITVSSVGPISHIAFLSSGEELEQYNASLVVGQGGAPYRQGSGLTFSEYCGPFIETKSVDAVLSDITVIPLDVPYRRNILATVSFNPQTNYVNFGQVAAAPTLSARLFDTTLRNEYFIDGNTCSTRIPKTIQAYYFNEETQRNVYLESGTFYLNTPPAPPKPEFLSWDIGYPGYPDPYSPYSRIGKLVVKGNPGTYKGVAGTSISFYINNTLDATYSTQNDILHNFFNVGERSTYQIHTTNNFNCKSPILTVNTGTSYVPYPSYPS
jgi:hypothetical protein